MSEVTNNLADQLRGARCRLVRAFAVSPSCPFDPVVAGHVERCSGCQNEVARERSIVKLLGQLRFHVEEAPPGLASSIVQAIASDLPQPQPSVRPVTWRQRAVAVSAVSALAVASIAAWRRLRTAAA